MRLAAAIWLATGAGCDVLFKLDEVSGDAVRMDAEIPFQFDAPQLDTAGWPVDGMVQPRTCDPGSTFNEDADALTDECDNCPFDANTEQQDTDRDGIGDICDPHPMFAVERMVLFDGFNTDLSLGTNIDGTWSIETGRLRQTRAQENRTLFALNGRWRQPTVLVRISNVNRVGNVRNWNVGTYQFGDVAGGMDQPDGIRCFAHFGDGGDMTMVRIRNTAGGPTSSAPFIGGDVMTLAHASHQLGAEPRCDGARAPLPFAQLTTQLQVMFDATDPEQAGVGVWTDNTRADFEAIAVYETVYP